GFGVPVSEWLLDRLGDEIRRELRAFCDETDLLDPGEVAALLARDRSHQPWFLFNLALWWKEYIR
ncbi:MAG: asparagine synthetase B, partial [Acidobacteriota bacterium]